MNVDLVHSRRSRRILPLAVALALLVAVFYAGPAGAEAGKNYTLTATPDFVVAGESNTFTFTVTNLADTQTLGSMNVEIPDGFTVQGVEGSTIELRNLDIPAGGSYDFTVTATADCDAGFAFTWTSTAKQANDYSGEGNDFTNVGADPSTAVACALQFTTQPADAEKDAFITGTAFDPFGPAVTVAVLDAAGQTLGAATGSVGLSGGSISTSAALSAGTASFPGISINASGTYALVAAYSSLSVTSSAFTVYDDVTQCNAGENCESQPINNGNTTGQVSVAGEDGALITLIVGDVNVTCSGFTPESQEVAFDVLNSGSVKYLTVRVSNPQHRAQEYETCFIAGSSFTEADGTSAEPIDIGGSTFYAGILPKCKGKDPRNLPCYTSAKIDRATGDLVVEIVAPAGDPFVHIG